MCGNNCKDFIRGTKIIMDKRKISFLLVLLLFFIAGNLFANEIDILFGHTSTKNTNSTFLGGVDFYFWEQEYKSKVFKTKKLKLGTRASYFSFSADDRNEVRCSEGHSIKLGLHPEFFISKNFSFNYKAFLGIGMYTREVNYKCGGCNDIKVQSLSKNFWELDLSIGATYFLTKCFGLSIDLGYRMSCDEDERKSSMPAFAPSGLIATLNIVCLYKV